MHKDGTLHGNRYLAPGTKVRLDNGGEIPFSEYGVIVHCWRDEQTSLFDCHIAFYGEEMPLGEPDEKPYILRYYASTLATVGIAIDEDADSGVQSPEGCCCSSQPDLAVVPIGGDGLDRRVFASLKRVAIHGGKQWWLYLSSCLICSQDWMIAQDERIYDNYYLRRLSTAAKEEIVDKSLWPNEFTTYERVLRLGRTQGQIWTFDDPVSPALTTTAEDLRRERPDITVEEIAYLLGISVSNAAKLLG